MPQIQRDSLLTLEAYSRSRDSFRKKVMAHKRHRRVPLGDHVMLIFEDELTIRYQVQEMLRAEKIFEEDEIRLETYNPLIPDGRNWKATMMIEYPDVEERKRALATLKGIEDRAYVQVEGSPRVYAIADEDLERENDEKTSSVHFLRFELTEDMAKALKYGVSLAIGVDHPSYRASIDPVSPEVRDALVADLA
jgi:hypothetical protein